MIALAALRKKADEQYPGIEMELEDGKSVTFRSVMSLSDTEMDQFTQSHKKLATLDEGDDLVALKQELVSILAGVSTDKALTAKCLDKESFGTLMLIFREYGSTTSDASKSEGDS